MIGKCKAGQSRFGPAPPDSALLVFRNRLSRPGLMDAAPVGLVFADSVPP